MYNNSLIYMTSTTESAVLANGVIPLTTIQRRRGKVIQNGTNSVILNAPGYYKVTASVTFTAPVAGDIAVELQKNNVSVPGISGSETITTATTELRTITLTGIVRVFCSEDIATLTLVNTGVAITAENVAFDVEYLD